MSEDLNNHPATWHGLATNAALSVEDRLGCALKGLQLYEAQSLVLEELYAVAEVVAGAQRLVNRYFPNRERGKGTEALDALVAAVDAVRRSRHD